MNPATAASAVAALTDPAVAGAPILPAVENLRTMWQPVYRPVRAG